MKLTALFIMLLAPAVCFGCTNKQTTGSDFSQTDSVFVYDFYKSINGISIDEAEPMIDRDNLEIDSTYFFEYTSPINGYIVKGIVKDLQQVSNINYSGYADLWFSDSISTRHILHSTFSLPDSVGVQLKTRKVNQLEYNLIHNENYNANELGQFSDVPFAFFDVDFDGEKELLLRHSLVGQRGISLYTPLQHTTLDTTLYDEIFIESSIDSSISESDEISYCLVLDDLTQFDINNKEIIMNLLVGLDGNQKIYFKVANRTAILYKIETFNKQWEQLVKRVTYTDTDTIIEQFE